VITVFLWQADGPQQGGRGVSADRRQALHAAADRLRSGQATSAVVEMAVTDLGMRTLTSLYCRTGRRWQARVGPAGRIWWVRATENTATEGGAN
jgi:hypothetical protein